MSTRWHLNERWQDDLSADDARRRRRAAGRFNETLREIEREERVFRRRVKGVAVILALSALGLLMGSMGAVWERFMAR